MKDKKHFLHHHDSSPASSPSSSSPPIHPSHSNSNPNPNPNPPPQRFSPSPTPNPIDDDTVELPRRRLGRPPGSKNKPKPPSSSSLSPNSIPHPLPSMQTLLLQIDPDKDVVDSVTRFCRNDSVSLSILSASGTLSHFTLRHPSSPPSNHTYHGKFDILSISATIVTESSIPSETRSNPSSFYLPSEFAVTVSGPQGQVVGGVVAGPMIAAGPVFIAAVSFDKPTYQRLPEKNEEEEEEEDDNEKRQPP